jgi:hypothetical protein
VRRILKETPRLVTIISGSASARLCLVNQQAHPTYQFFLTKFFTCVHFSPVVVTMSLLFIVKSIRNVQKVLKKPDSGTQRK